MSNINKQIPIKSDQGYLIPIIEGAIPTKSFFWIPIYQRNYTWNKHNCDELFRDIQKIDLSTQGHFIGFFLFKEHNGEIRYQDKFEIIDGQQRFTTILLLAKALSELCDNEENAETKQEIEKILFLNYPSNDRLRLETQIKEFKIFEKIMKGEFLEESEKSSVFYVNYSFFQQKMKSEGINPTEFWKKMKKLYCVTLDLEEGLDAHLIFEKMNSTGKELVFHDLIRNFLLVPMNNESEEELESKWIEIEKQIDKNDLKNFFIIFMNLKKIVFKTANAYEKFKNFVYKEYKNKKDVLKEISDYVSLFLTIQNPELKKLDLNSNNKYLLHLFNENQIYLAFPPLLTLLKKYREEKELFTKQDISDVIKMLLNYYIRSFVLGIEADKQKAFYNNLEELINNVTEKQKIFDFIVSKLKHTIPKLNIIFEERFKHDLKYTPSTQPRIKLILYLIEHGFNPSEHINLKTISIEHFFPQAAKEEIWKYEDPEEFKQMKNDYLHNIGNLTLIGEKLNSELSNKSAREKIKLINDTKFNKKLKPSFLSENNSDENFKWGTDEVETRSNYLCDELFNVLKISEIDDQDDNDNDNKKYTISLLDNLNLKRVSFYGLKIGNKEVEFNDTTAKSMLISFVEELWARYKDIFKEKIKENLDSNFSFENNRWADKSEKYSHKLKEANIYFMTNYSTSAILDLIKKLSECFDLNPYEIKITYMKNQKEIAFVEKDKK